MCGIAGIVDLRVGLPDGEELVARMTDALAYRGPDDAGLLVDPPAVLGHRRLAILDLSSAGHQPMATEDGELWITYNGEVYNYLELGRELRGRGYRLRSSCDTEVLLYAYAEWGLEALSRLNGMFAFAIWNRRRRELFCARDRFGVKPFYYTVAEGRFRFASEIKALLLDPAVPRVANDARVLDFLAHGLADHTEDTMFEGIRQLPAGSFFVVTSERGVERPRIWYRPTPVHRDNRPPSAELRERLTDAVALRLRSDVPVGVALSGGMDSSSVMGIASRLLTAAGVSPPASFSARCRDPRLDEWPYVERTLRATGSLNRQVLPDGSELLDELDLVLWHMDEPFHAPSVYGQRRVHHLARSSGVIVLLDGQGGDEALAGYHHFHYAAFLSSLCFRGRVMRALEEAQWRRRRHNISLRRSAKDVVKLFLPRRLRARRIPTWLHPDAAVPIPPLPGPTLREHQKYGLTTSPLPAWNHHEDRNSMAFSLEARNPFLDYRVVEYGLALRAEDLLHDGVTKWALREAVRDIVPPEVVQRSAKQGFSTDQAAWLRGELGGVFEETFRSESLGRRSYFDPKQLLAALESHRSGQSRDLELWRAFVVERWLSLFIDPTKLHVPAPLKALRISCRGSNRVVCLTPTAPALAS